MLKKKCPDVQIQKKNKFLYRLSSSMDMPRASQVYKKEIVKAPERKRYNKKKK